MPCEKEKVRDGLQATRFRCVWPFHCLIRPHESQCLNQAVAKNSNGLDENSTGFKSVKKAHRDAALLPLHQLRKEYSQDKATAKDEAGSVHIRTLGSVRAAARRTGSGAASTAEQPNP